MLVLALVGCSQASALVVDLRTDLRPGLEFATVRLELHRGAELATPIETRLVPVDTTTDALSGLRIAELTDLENGTWLVVLRLLDASEREVATGRVRVRVQGAIAVTVLVTRDCQGVMCPMDGSPTATVCVGERCVDPRCSPETPEYCPPPQCGGDADCVSTSPDCIVAQCVSGVCFELPDDTMCPGGTCSPDVGCQDRPECAVDADCVSTSPDCVVAQCESGGCVELPDDAMCPGGTCDPEVGCQYPTWSRAYGGTGRDVAQAIATDSEGNVYVGGRYSDTVDFGGGPVTSMESYDNFLVSLSPSGAHRWTHTSGGVLGQQVFGIAIDADDNVTFVGEFSGTVDFGGVPLRSAGSVDVFMVSLTRDGVHRWSRAFGTAGLDAAMGVVADAAGNLYVAGFGFEAIDVGGGTLPYSGSADIFVASYTSAGDHRWSSGFGGSSTDQPLGIAIDALGNVTVVGNAPSTGIDFGGGAHPGRGTFIASFDSDGTHRWSRVDGGSSSVAVTSVAAFPGGDVVVSGTLWDPVDFGGGPLASMGTSDIFVVRFSSTGEHVWSRSFPGTGDNRGRCVSRSGDVIWVSGDFEQMVDLGGGPLTSAGGADIFVASYSGTGEHLSSRRYGGDVIGVREDAAVAMAADERGVVYVTGTIEGMVPFPDATQTSAGEADVFVLRLAPE